jgi:hypothetical protein
MKIEDWFALAVRVVGIAILLIPGLWLLLDGLLFRLGYFNSPDTHLGYYLVYGGAQVAAGLYLLRGAPFLIDFAYPTTDEGEVEADQNRS